MGIWPRPRHVETSNGVVWLSTDVFYQYRRSGDETPSTSSADSTVGVQAEPDGAAENRKSAEETAILVGKIFERTKETILKFPFALKKLRGQDIPPEPSPKTDQSVVVREIVIEEVLDSELSDAATSSEWYHIRLESDGKCLIQISSHVGMNLAMATFAQLFYAHSDQQSGFYCASSPVTIKDHAFFQHRGLNLDISRNIIYPTDVQRVLEGMWLNKMNKLHLHATDSQSWPIEIPSLPDLASKGAYDPSQIWTVADVEHIQQFGEDRGIEVYFEIDLPGHTASIHHSFPELILAYNRDPWDEFAKEPPAGQLKLKSEAVRDFITQLFDDFLPRVAKHSKLFHIGGDELNRKCYTLEEGIKSDSKNVLRPLLQSFYDHCVTKLDENSLNPILWEEVLLNWDIEFPKSAIFQSWKSQKSLSQIVEKGHRAVFGPCQFWYLDTGLGGFLDPNPNNPKTPVKHPFSDWCPPYKNWRAVYSYNPFEGIKDKHKGLIHGGEVHLWTEMTDSVCLDFMLWPRVSAAAEVLWSGPSTVDEGVTRRLAEMRERLVGLGIRSAMVQMEWSLRNPGSSTL